MSKRIERQIQKIYLDVFKKVFNKTTIEHIANNRLNSAKLRVDVLVNSKQFDDFCKRFAKQLAQQGLNRQKGIWRKYFNAAKATNYVAISSNYKEFEKKIMANVVFKNFEMIKSIPKKVLELTEKEYCTKLIENVMLGRSTRKELEQALKQHGAKNAKMIARTETAKLQTAIIEQRATNLGSVVYQWLSSNDKRTRESHRLMNNVIVFWRENYEERPSLDGMYGNAGEFPNCRCECLPLFNEDDLKKNIYTVYDYRYKKLIKMTKNELKAAMQVGRL